MDRDFCHILIVGGSVVGKTALFVRYTQGEGVPVYVPTIGIDFRMKTLARNDKQIKLRIWDTPGLEKYLSIVTAYFPGTNGFILMFDLTSSESFREVDKWVEVIHDLSSKDAQVILVGNKSDLTDKRKVTTEQAQEKASSIGARYFETSTLKNININEVFDSLVDEFLTPSGT